MRASELKAHLDALTVRELLEGLGYDFDRSGRFSIREERTPSASIHPKSGRITDFGGEFRGDLFDLLQAYQGMTLPQAVNYVTNTLGLASSNGEAPIKRKLPATKPEEPPRSLSLDEVRREYEGFEPFDSGDPDHLRAYEGLFPSFLYEGAHPVDRTRFSEAFRFDRKRGHIVAGCFDEAGRLISYKRRAGGWRVRKGTHPNGSLWIRSLRTRPGPLHIVEGTSDALAALLLGLNYAALPTASYRPKDEGIAALWNAVIETTPPRFVRMWAEDDRGEEAMERVAERLGAFAEAQGVEIEGEISNYPGFHGKKLDLRALILRGKNIEEVKRWLS